MNSDVQQQDKSASFKRHVKVVMIVLSVIEFVAIVYAIYHKTGW
jgi:hypothetical protein